MEVILNWFLGIWNQIVFWFSSGQAAAWFNQNILPVIIAIIGAVFTGIIGGLARNIVKALKERTKNENVKSLLSEIDSIIAVRTDETTQVFVSNLKKTNTFDVARQKEAMSKTIEKIKDDLSKSLKKFIEKNYGKLDSYLKTKVEAYLHREK